MTLQLAQFSNYLTPHSSRQILHKFQGQGEDFLIFQKLGQIPCKQKLSPSESVMILRRNLDHYLWDLFKY